jgi:transposase
MMDQQDFAAYIGLDWGDRQHALHLRIPEQRNSESFQLEQKPEALHEWIAQLRNRFHTGRVAVAIEQRKGAVIHALMMYDFLILYPINPKALARYREAFQTSGAKDDPTDAELLLDFLSKHSDKLRPWVPDSEPTRKLLALSEQRRKLVNRRVALANRITSLLKQYFPQALDWIGDVASIQACDFLECWPTLDAVQHIDGMKLQTFYRRHNCRRASVISERLQQMASARPLTTDSAIIEPYSLVVEASAVQLRNLIRAIQKLDKRIAELFCQHPEHDLFDSFPGAGAVCGPRLLTVFGTDRSRWASPVDLLCHSGIAPVTERSGNSCWIHHRRACAKFVKQTFHEFADQSIRYSKWARAYYDLLRARGKNHHASLRALAYKWIRIIFRCWKDRKPYNEEIYIQSLRRRGSPVAEKLKN